MFGSLFSKLKSLFPLVFFCISQAFGATPDWSEGFVVSLGGRSNPYSLQAQELSANVYNGRIHAQIYPVRVTEIVPPYQPILNVLGDGRNLSSLKSSFTWLGLQPYPTASDVGVYAVPFPGGKRPNYPIGFTPMNRNGALGFTFGCATCHASNLFGKTVLGMSNRFPRANEAFLKAQSAAWWGSEFLFQAVTGANEQETKLYAQTRAALQRVGLKEPLVLGLDTSLAQVALSLGHRAKDPYASFDPSFENYPRPDRLDSEPGDSKPAVWWNLKYKNRWLSDGSVVSGNPIFTNLLWNEVGRGTDLQKLESWLVANSQIIQELTTAVFSSEAPRFTDFFQITEVDLVAAKRGEILFKANCSRCHGNYEKAWSLTENSTASFDQQFATTQVLYPQKTVVANVGTDPYRRLAMSSLEQLNDLRISKIAGTVIKPQKGYVPPPLVGIWARWPYFHNNSVPNLCALLTAGPQRPQVYYSGEAENPQKDFDRDCNGYPLGNKTPSSWKTEEHRYDARIKGLSNLGHDENIILDEGVERLTQNQKMDLIRFLQSL